MGRIDGADALVTIVDIRLSNDPDATRVPDVGSMLLVWYGYDVVDDYIVVDDLNEFRNRLDALIEIASEPIEIDTKEIRIGETSYGTYGES